ncbi:Hypothetical predicted protein [Lecanosticta acicola]|uniref:Methyltransferase domain-containing protein n=1 Tax=Lecanosticta acicola TaxID=111012 RepID=A0AAI8YTJ7_9PEZI|nr:Hypothetical predicted protein [Lecanosticta acicola]
MDFVQKNQYNSVANEYPSIEDVPHSKVEDELVKIALADCTGLKVLDLGGRFGLHARQALDAGASWVDVVDVSQSMLDVGKGIEDEAGRGIIGWHLADISKPLSAQVPDLPQDGYDVVMAIWPFDHARTVKELEGMWRNVAAYMKPGGRFVGVRVANPYAQSARTGKYGSQFRDLEEIADGVNYECAILATPRFAFEATSMETSYSGSTEIPEKYGLCDVTVLHPKDTQTVKRDPDYWAMLVEDTHFVAFTARKK